MLCGAPSLLSKAMLNAMFCATMVAVPPAGTGLPAGAGAAGVPVGAADAPEQAASTAARASRPKVRVRRFMSIGLLVSMLSGWSGSGAGSDRAAARDECREGGELAADDRDRASVVADEVDGDEDDQRDLDGLRDVRGGVVGAHDRPAEDRGRGVADEADPDDPAETDGERERDDHRHGGDHVADRVEREQQAAERGMDVGGAEDECDDRGADDHVAGAEGSAGGEHRVVDLSGLSGRRAAGVGPYRRAALWRVSLGNRPLRAGSLVAI